MLLRIPELNILLLILTLSIPKKNLTKTLRKRISTIIACYFWTQKNPPPWKIKHDWLSKWGSIDFNELFRVSLLGRETLRMHRGSNKNILKHDLIFSLDIMEYCIETIHTSLPWSVSTIRINTTAFFQELITTLAMK